MSFFKILILRAFLREFFKYNSVNFLNTLLFKSTSKGFYEHGIVENGVREF
jgi:hypothetical protein